MSSFTTRVVLKGNPANAQYDELHTAMEAAGFSRIISSNDGIKYELPPAEYNIVGHYSRSDVLDLAKESVEGLGEASILVTESAGRIWSNLRKTT